MLYLKSSVELYPSTRDVQTLERKAKVVYMQGKIIVWVQAGLDIWRT